MGAGDLSQDRPAGGEHDLNDDGVGVFRGCLVSLLIYAVVGSVIGLIYLIVR